MNTEPKYRVLQVNPSLYRVQKQFLLFWIFPLWFTQKRFISSRDMSQVPYEFEKRHQAFDWCREMQWQWRYKANKLNNVVFNL